MRLTKLSLCLLFTALSIHSLAVDKFWRPLGTPNWNSAFNWSPTGVPNSGDVVHFDTFDGTDCFVNTNVNVAGVILDAGYTGVVWLQGTNSFTVGANGYIQHDGTFQCADGTVTFNGPFDQQGGAFSTTLGDHYFNNTVNIAPAAPGFFNDNGGWIIFGGGNNVTLNQSYQLLNVRVQKTGGSVLTLAAGQQITINQQLELITGYVAGPGRLRLFGDGFVGSSMNSSSATLELYGTGSREFKINAFNWGQDVIEITNGANYFFRSDNSTLNILQAGDSLKILLGHAIMDHPNVYLRPNAVFMASSGQFTASSGNTYLERGWINEGSGFNANGGVFYLSAGNNATMDLTSEQVFYDLVCAKSGGANLNLTDNSKIRVSNKYTASSGYLNGSNGAVINAVDSVVINSTYVQGTCPLHFVGDQNGTFIYNSSSNLFSELRIKKDAVNDTVHFETTTSTLNIGDVSSDPIVVEQGTLAFKDYGNHVDWNVVNTTVESNGKFVAPEGTIYFNGNYTANGGSFDHNMGTVRFDNGNSRTWNGNTTTRFYNLRMEKSGGASVTIDGSDQLIVENLMTFATGYLNGPSALVACEKDVLVTNTYVQGNAPVACVGPADGVFTYNSSSNLFDLLTINKDTPSTSVSFGSTNSFLNIGDGVTDPIVIQQGTLRFENFGSHVDWDVFSTTVESDGTFEAPAGTIYFNGNYTANGGSFEHNMGFVRFNDSSNRSWDGNSCTRFYDLRMEKSGGANVVIQGTDSLIVENLMTISSGYLNGPNALLACEKDMTITNTYVQGDAPAAFIGDEASNLTYNSSSNLFDLLTINKDEAQDTVFFGTTNGFLNIGDVGVDPILIQRGVLAFQNVGSYVDWDINSTTVEADGTFEAYSGTTYFNGHYTSNGGHFEHNMGEFRFNNGNNRNWNANGSVVFYDLIQEKSGGANVNISNGDSIIVINSLLMSSGYLNGHGRIDMRGDVTIGNSHVKGTLDLLFTGANNTMNNLNTGLSFDTLEVDMGAGQLTFIDGNAGTANSGSTAARYIQRSGAVDFNTFLLTHNWKFLSTTIEGGSFTLPVDDLYVTGSLALLGGSMEGNGGRLIFSGGSNVSAQFEVSPQLSYVDFTKSGGAAVTLSGAAPMVVNEILQFLTGYVYDSEIVALGDVILGNSLNIVSSQVSFNGTTDQNFDLNNSPNKLEGFIEIDKASGDVVLQSNLTIEDNFAQLMLTNGNITMADPSYRVIFGNAVDTGWSGGGNNSFIDGIARKQGTGTLELPIGDNGFWGMITITGVNTASEYYDAEFHHVDPASAGLVGMLDTGLDHISSCEYWSTAHVGSFSPSVGLSFYEDRCGPINAPADLRVTRFESGTWFNEGYSFHDSDEVFASNVDPIMGAFTLASATPSNPMDGSGAVGCPEDFNGDGVVAAADLLELLSQFGCVGSCSADLNGDGQVAAADLLQFLSAFGSNCN